MNLMLLGISHHTAPVELRERLALDGKTLAAATTQLRARYPMAEVVVLSTCNRVEWYVARPVETPPTIDELRNLVATAAGVLVADLTAASIHRENLAAVEHLFRVSCGIESMVLGEPQILGQIKRAYEQAVEQHTVGAAMHTLFQQTLATGKQVRSATGIDVGRLSIGSAAVDFARQIFDTFSNKTVVGIGAGEMAKLTLRHLKALDPQKLWLVNRTPERAHALADALGVTGSVRHFDDLDALLIEADIILTSTASREPILTADRVAPLIRRRRGRPLFIIDIAVPRDVEAAVGTLSNVYLYDIDDLQHVVDQTQSQRQAQAADAAPAVRAAAEACLSQIQNRDIGRLIAALRKQLHDVGELESQRTRRRLQNATMDDVPAILDEHTERLINKILHMPVSQLNQRQPAAALGFFAAALSRLFRLDAGNVAPPQPTDETQQRAERT